MQFLGNIFGLVYTLFRPIKIPRRDFLIASIMACIFLLVIPLTTYLKDYAWPLLLLSNICSGFFRSFIVAPYLILLQYYDAYDKDKRQMNVWSNFGCLGDIISVAAFGLMLSKFGWDWKISFSISVAALFIILMIHYLVVEQISLQDSNQKEGIRDDIGIYQLIQIIKNFFGQTANVLWMVDLLLEQCIYYCVLLWFPYYFVQIGFKSEYILISITYLIFFCIGSLIYEYLMSYCPTRQNKSIYFLLFCNFLLYCYMAFYGSQSNHIVYVILTGVSGFISAGPYGVFISSGNYKKVANFLLTIFVGAMMQINLRSFLFVLFGLSLLNFLVDVGRKLVL